MTAATKKPPVMRFVCVPCKTELIFNPGVSYAEANAQIGREGWRIMQLPEPFHYWALCCAKCVGIIKQ